MNNFIFSKEYKRDLKKLALKPEIMMSAEFIEVMYCLLHGTTLPEKYKDHALTGNWANYRDCHIKNDLVLIYKMAEENVYLARLGSHSELFG